MILLAVSGGIDSMYMANRASEIFPGESFAVAHCNFHLRGEESDEDEAFVRRWCSCSGVECLVRHFDTAGYAKSRGISIEMAARDLRYAWFAELMQERGFEAVAVAHNADDNAETLLLNLLRGTGSRGIRGMSARDNGRGIIRPLLSVTRAEIRAWMCSRSLSWREDSTNAETDCKRNRLRNAVFPLLKEINPSVVRTLGEDMKRFAQVDDIAEEYFASVKDSVSEQDGTISVKPLLELRHWRYVLWRLVEHCSMSAPTFDKLCALLSRYASQPTGTVTLSGKVFESSGYILRADGRKLTISRK